MAKVAGKGTKLSYGAGVGVYSTETWTDLAGVWTGIPLGNASEPQNNTPIDAATGTFEYLDVDVEPEPFEFEIQDNYGNVAFETFMEDIVAAKLERNMRMVYPNGRILPFRVRFVGWQILSPEANGGIRIKIKARMTDVPDWVSAP